MLSAGVCVLHYASMVHGLVDPADALLGDLEEGQVYVRPASGIAGASGLTLGGKRRDVPMVGIEKRDFDAPDETRTPDKTRVDIVRIGDTTVGRFTFQPGWRWSECIQPVAGTDSCQNRHVGVVTSGRLAVHHNDGTELVLTPGNAYVIEPSHDAWVVGDDPFIAYEFESRSAQTYARG